jgi:hypothetical protein
VVKLTEDRVRVNHNMPLWPRGPEEDGIAFLIFYAVADLLLAEAKLIADFSIILPLMVMEIKPKLGDPVDCGLSLL